VVYVGMTAAALLLQACAAPEPPKIAKAPDPSQEEVVLAKSKDYPQRSSSRIILRAKPEISMDDIKKFIAYLNCRIVQVLSEEGRLIEIEAPAVLNEQKILSSLRKHPWIIQARMKEEKKTPAL